MSTFIALNTASINQLISTARSHVGLIAPAVMMPIASSLIDVSRRLGPERVHVIIDYSESSFRLGYGKHDAICMLEQEGIAVRTESGLRISLLVVDDRAWVFHQCPAAIEDPEEYALNALPIGTDQVNIISAAAGIGAAIEQPDSANAFEPAAVVQPEIGRDTISDDQRSAISRALEISPPQAFDVQRQVNVYKAHLQFVEIELEGGRTESRKIQLPSNLRKQLFRNNNEVDARLSASYRVFESTRMTGLQAIRDKVEDLRNYTQSVDKHYGRVMLTVHKTGFLKLKEKIERDIQAWKSEATTLYREEMGRTIRDLAKAMAPLLLDNPPIQLTSRLPHRAGEVDVVAYLEECLGTATPDPAKMADSLQLRCTFKDVTYEMLKDSGFQDRISELFPALQAQLMDEFVGLRTRHDVADGADSN